MSRSRKFHVSPYKPVTVKPAAGGRLMTNVSAETAGIYNYTTKRDWRRVLEHEVRSEGHDFFWPNTDIPIGNQPYPNALNNEPITLIHEVRKPNGNLAVIAGTPTTLYRYFSLSNGAYYTGDGTPNEYYSNLPDGTSYYDDNPGVWIKIGDGFSTNAQRWEAEDLDGITILNNGVDLPVTYDTADTEVKPIYELRESGIAAVGNISVSNEMLLCADVQEIHADALTDLLSLISSNGITAQQTGSQSSQPSGTTATMINNLVNASRNFFSPASVGQTIQFYGGASAVISQYIDHQNVIVQAPSPQVALGQPFFLINPGNADYTVSASAAFFTANMVGQNIIFDSGQIRTITQFIDVMNVVVNSNSPIAATTFRVSNPAAYATYTDGDNIDRIQYRIINSMISEARRWAASVPGTIAVGSKRMTFQYPAMSFQEIVGQQITIIGAGVNGGNLLATLVYLAPDNMSAIIDTPAKTAVTNQPVQASDATGGNVGFIDLEDDGSGIVAMKDLLGNLVVYKDTAIFLGTYTGGTGAPFNFTGNTLYRGSKTLYYRNTLVQVVAHGQVYHLFAGRNSFYRYDLVYQQPMELDALELCKNLFFNNVGQPSQVDPIGVFAADNPITKEIFFCFPNANGPDFALRFDYFTGQASTTSGCYTAAAAVKRPESGLQTGVSMDWFVMGTANGTMLRYGLTDEEPVSSPGLTITQAGNAIASSAPFFTSDMVGKSVQFPDLSVVNVVGVISPTQINVGGPATNRSATVFNVVSAIYHRCGQPYDSVMASGLDSFGVSFGEKEIESWVISLSSKSPNTPLLFELLGTVNPTKPAAVLGSKLLTNPQVQSAAGMLFIQNYFQDRITISGMNNPAEVVARVLNIAGVDSRAFIQR